MGVPSEGEDEDSDLSPSRRLAHERAESISAAEVIDIHKVLKLCYLFMCFQFMLEELKNVVSAFEKSSKGKKYDVKTVTITAQVLKNLHS